MKNFEKYEYIKGKAMNVIFLYSNLPFKYKLWYGIAHLIVGNGIFLSTKNEKKKGGKTTNERKCLSEK